MSASPQLFCSSEGTVVFIHGFAPPGLASNHRGWGQFIHTQFLPGGRRASLRPFSICRSPYADHHTETASGRSFCLGLCGTDKIFQPRSKNSGNDLRLSSLDLSALGGAECAGHPTRNQPPSVGGSVLAAPGTLRRGPLLVGHRLAAWRNYSPQSQGYCCSKSSVRFRFSARREIVLTVRGDTSFCSIRGCLRTTAMIDTVTMVLALMSGSIFLAHALDGLRSRA